MLAGASPTSDSPTAADPMAEELTVALHDLRFSDSRDSALEALSAHTRALLATALGTPGTQPGGKTKRPSEEEARRAAAQLRVLVPQLYAYTANCPFAAIRVTCADLLDVLRQDSWGASGPVPVPPGAGRAAVLVPVSHYIDGATVPPVETADADVLAELCEAFEADGRVSNMTRVMAVHPRFLASFRASHNSMLYGDGPLPVDHRHLLAVLAAARHQCTYLVKIHSKQFLALGGNPLALEDAAHLPPKLRLILPLNAVLAHQPWKLTPEHVGTLLRESWSVTELAHAMALLAHFHALCSFVFGCGICPELDLDAVPTGAPSASDAPDSSTTVAAGAGPSLAAPVPPAAPAAAEEAIRDIVGILRCSDDDVRISQEANMQSFLGLETDVSDTQSVERQTTSGASFVSFACALQPAERASSSVEGHVDFDISRDKVLRTQNFSWADHGFSTFTRYCPALADVLDHEFQVTKDLTYEFLGSAKSVDTFKFRWAIWNYVFRIKGVINDEYMYEDVNKFIKRPLKGFVKTVTCYPQLCTRAQFHSCLGLLDSEMVHVVLLAVEARKQAELMYALNALVKHVMG